MKKELLTEHMRRFLISLRESAKLSQAQVSLRSGISQGKLILDQKTVSRIESNPLDGDVFKINAYMSAVGSSLDEYSKVLQSFIQQYRGSNMDQSTKSSMFKVIDNTMDKVEKAKEMLAQFEHDYIKELKLDDALEQSVSNLKGLKRKPVIGFFGHYDSGKSTLVNTVINNDFLPVRYQPATSIVNLLIHKDDQPSYLTGDVSLFRKGFLPHMIHSEELVKEYLIEEGGKEILEKYGTHDWDSETMDRDAYISVSYIDASILNRVWLLDTPGNLNESESQDTEFAVSGVELVDGVVFLSQHSGYMNGPSVSFLTDIIRKRVPSSKENALDHIVFVKTHCHSGMTDDEIEAVELTTMKRIHKQLDTTVFSSWKVDNCIDQTPSAEALADRTVSFWRETEKLRLATLSHIEQMSFFLMENQDQLVEQRVVDVEKAIVTCIKNGIAKLESFKRTGEERLQEVKDQDARFRQKSDALIKQFEETIDSTSGIEHDCLNDLKMYFNSLTSVGSIESLINENFDDKKEAEQGIGGVISQLLSTKLESTLKSQSKPFNTQIDRLLESWQEIAPKSTHTSTNIEIDGMNIDGFDARSAWVGGLAGLGSFGAMALYVSGIASNLGAYILVGKAAGVLTSLGLASSVTSVTSFVAAIGGPITIGIAIAAAIGYAVYRIFGGKWQPILAKKVKEALDKKSPLEDVNKVIRDFWESTRVATKACLTELQAETEKHIEKLYTEAGQDFSVEDLDKCIKSVKTLTTPFES